MAFERIGWLSSQPPTGNVWGIGHALHFRWLRPGNGAPGANIYAYFICRILAWD